jgi:hypothetical protein
MPAIVLRFAGSAPKFINPCRPTSTKRPVGEALLHEPKLDGYRLQVVKDGRESLRGPQIKGPITLPRGVGPLMSPNEVRGIGDRRTVPYPG